MSLRDKLRVLSQGTEGMVADELATDWTDAVAALFRKIREFVSEYETENLLSLSEERISIQEDGIGIYATSRLNIRSGKSLVRLTPVGRLVAGALGRVDFASGDSPQRGYMLLRQGFTLDDWQIAHRQPNRLLSTAGGSLEFGPIVFAEPLAKGSFELALDSLLR